LSAEVLNRINELLPDLGPRFDEILSLNPDILSVAFHRKRDVKGDVAR
jgi:hypothetical protein